MNAMFQLDRLYPYALPPAITFLVSFFLAALVIQTGDRNKENKLFIFFCLLNALINLATTLTTVITSKVIALSICRFADMFYVFIIPVCFQFICEALEIPCRKTVIRGLYFFSLALCFSTQTHWYYNGIQKFYFGFFPTGGPAFQLFGGIGLVCLVYFVPILWTKEKYAPKFEERLKARFILYGIVVSIVLTAGNALPILGIPIYPPGNFGFIPLGLIGYGLLQHNLLQTTKSAISKDFLPRLLTIIVWAPLIIAFLFWLTAKPGIFYPDISKRIFPYALPPILSIISCFVVATFCFMQRIFKPETFLFGLIATIWGYLNLDIGFNMLHTDQILSLQISRFCHMFLVYQIGLSVHFIYSVIDRKQRWTFVYPCYVFGFLLMLFTQSNWYFQGSYHYYWGFFAKENILFSVFGAASFGVIIWGVILLYNAVRTETDIDEKKKYIFVLIGVLVTGILNMFNIPALNGIALYPLGNFTFIPIIIMAYGIFRHNILKINIYTRRRILEKTVRIILMAGYLSLILIFYWAVSKDRIAGIHNSSQWGLFDPNYIFGKIYPFGIPPLISFICATYFSMLAIRLGRNLSEAIIFSLLCFLMAFISFDILMNGIVSDESIGIHISRMQHLFLVFAPAISLHLIYIVIRRRDKWWIVYSAYGIGLILMPFTQTRYYIQGMYHYFWGFYAKGAVLFNVFAAFLMIAIGYGTMLLIRAYKKTDQPFQKHRLFYLTAGFIATATLYIGNVFTLKGYEIYPPGNFVFIPLVLWAYALFRQNLNDALQITRTFLFYLGLFFASLIIALSLKKILPSQWPVEVYLLGIILCILILTSIKYIWNNILTLFFGERKEKLEHVLDVVHNSLSTSRTLHSIFQILKNTIFNELLCSRYTMLFSGAAPAVHLYVNKSLPAYSGWQAWNPKKTLFSETDSFTLQDILVDLRANHPLLGMFNENVDLISREQVEEWLMEHDMTLNSKDPLGNEEYILPIYFEKNLSCLILFGSKIDGSLYSNDEKDFIHRFGLSLGPYLENAKLLQEFEKKVEERTFALKNALDETKAKEEEITHINEVIQIINSTLDLNVLLSSFKEALKPIFDFSQIGIFLLDEEDHSLYLTNYAGKGITQDKVQALRNIYMPIKNGVSLNCDTLLRNEPVCVPEVTPEFISNATPVDKKAFEINPMKAMLICPMEIQKKVIGTIVFAHTDKHFSLTDSDIDKIQRYVSQIATAVTNARLTEKTQKALLEAKTKELEIAHINQVVQTVNSTLNIDEVLKSLMQALQGIFTFNQIGIMLIDENRNELFFYKPYGKFTLEQIRQHEKARISLKKKKNWFTKTVLEKKPIYIPKITPDLVEKFEPFDRELYALGTGRSFLAYPLEVQKKVVGVIVFGNCDEPFKLSDDDIIKIQRYVTHIVSAINNARLAEEIRRALLETKTKEKEISRINQIVQIVNSTLDLDEVAYVFSNALKEIFDFDQMSIQLLNENKDELFFVKTYGEKKQNDHLHKLIGKGIPLSKAQSLFIQPIIKKRPIYIPQITPEMIKLMADADRKIYKLSLAKAYLFLPIKVQNEIIGTISFGNTRTFFTLERKDIERVEHFVSQIATAIHNARIYEDLNTARAEAEAATQYKSDFLANMSHEIRTPLNAILGLTRLTLDTALTPKQMDYLKKIKDSSNALFRIVNDILDFSKIEAGKLNLETVEFKIDDVMANLANMFSGQVMEKGIEMIFTRSPDIPETLEGDPLRLGQILTNLVGNAFKFTDHGEILIRAELLKKNSKHTILKFIVKDTGIGIDPENLMMLFDPFIQADGSTTRKYGGTGLGLTICKQLVEMMDGEINAESIPGKGSTFYFTAKFGCPEEKPKKLPVPHPDLRGLKVLVVDDNKTVQMILMEILASFKFEPTAVSSGEAALAALFEAKKDNSFDLVLLDWKLPGMDGIECARQIRKHPDFKNIPIVMMTAFGREDIKEQADQAGINAYLAKPMTSSMMIDTFMEVFGRITQRKIMADALREKELQAYKKLQGARLLLVEDNPINQQVAVELLKGVGLNIDIANNGKEACEAVSKSDYDVVLMDVQMPVMDGYAATQQIRKHLGKKDLPIIAMTAHAMVSEKRKCLDAGMNDHISKPIDPKVVFETLSRWVKPALLEISEVQKTADYKAPPEAVVDVKLPEGLPGIDVAIGVNRVAGNKMVYRDLLIQFRNKYLHIAEDIQTAITDSRFDHAGILAHTVKGVAGNVGAFGLHQIAGDLERAIRNNSKEEMDHLLVSFKDALAQLFASIKILEEDAAQKADFKPVHKIAPEDVVKIELLLSECSRLLKSDFAEAMNTVNRLRKILKNTSLLKPLMNLEENMDDFNIDGALTAIAEIAKDLHLHMK